MTSRLRTALLGLLLAALLSGSTGCTEQKLTGTPGKDIKVLPASTIPRTLGGLTVKQENLGKQLKAAKHSYVDAVGFYSLRQGKVVQGTIQVSRFGPTARLDDPEFRKNIIDQSSPGTTTALNVAGATVQQSTGTKSTVSIWFSKERMIVLTVLNSYQGARGLLEQAIAALPE